MKTVSTFTATIYLSLTEGYGGPNHTTEEVRTFLLSYFRDYFCVTVTPTEFVYKSGWEAGVVIGIINYPRNPESARSLRRKAIDLAKELKKEFKQNRVSVVFSKDTIMLESCGEK